MVDISAATWVEVDSSNNAASPLGWTPSAMLPTQVEPTAQAMMGATKRFWDRINGTVTTTGSSGTYVYTPVSTTYPTAYIQGETYSFKSHQASAGNDTLNVNSLGAKKIYKTLTTGNTQIIASDIQTGQHCVAQYDSALDSSNGGFLLLNPATSAVFPAQPGATVTNPMSSNLVLTSGSKQVQTVAPNAASLAVQLPDATTYATAGATVFEINNLTTNGAYPVQVIDSASKVIGWVLPARKMFVHLDSISSATGNWRLMSSDADSDATGCWLTNSWTPPTVSTVTDTTIFNAAQLSATNGIVAVVNTTTLTLYCWQEGENGKTWGASTTQTVTSGTWATVVPLTATTGLLIYRNTNIICAVVSINTGTLAVTINATSTITTDTAKSNKYIGAAALSSTLVWVPYLTSAGAIKGATVSVSGTTATANTVVGSGVTTTGAGASGLASCALSATLSHVYFVDSSNGLSVMRVTFSGTVPTWASAVVVKSDTAFVDFQVGTIDATHSVVAYHKNAAATDAINAAIVTDASPVTVGSEITNLIIGRRLIGGALCVPLIVYGAKAYALLCGLYGQTTYSQYFLARFSLTSSTVTLDAIRPIMNPNMVLATNPAEIFPFGGIFQLPWLDSASHYPIPQTVLGVAA